MTTLPMAIPSLYVETRRVPGSKFEVVGTASNILEARKIAKTFAGRKDLTFQDVMIRDSSNGELVEYAGPSR